LHRCTGPEHPECPDETFGDETRYYPTRLIELPPYGQDINAMELFSQMEQGEENPREPKEEWVRLVTTKGCVVRPVRIEERKVRVDKSRKKDHQRKVEKPDTKQEQKQQGLLPNEDAPKINGPTSCSDASQRSVDSSVPIDSHADISLPPNFPKDDKPQGEYVTLSHCWGKAKMTCLMTYNEEDFKNGIRLRQLPLTFQHAVNFARRLSRSVRYIWIDALCIIQDDKDDWAHESGKMYEVYRNSYCNLSATKAKDSTEGLHFRRDPHLLWEDEINLNTEGIYRPLAEREHKSRLGLEPLIRRCTIRNASFWNRQVDDAVVNRRAWVLQERLLAPRVLHFCKDQVAWECRHVDAAESLPHGISTMELKAGTVGQRTRLKTLVPEEHGRRVLAPIPADDSYVAHENWKHIVERYSRTALTKDQDKLIALAGIAELMSSRIGKNMFYVAGMWERFLASQLLWRVPPRYEDGRLKYPQRRVSDPGGPPTFSWAAVVAPQGISCGKTLREDKLKISVENIHVEPTISSRPFGLIKKGCYIDITCCLREIQIEEAPGLRGDVDSEDAEKSVRYIWRLVGGNEATRDMRLSNLYMDSPREDIRKGHKTYCIPAYVNPEGGSICLLVQRLPESKSYKRIGLAVVPEFENTENRGLIENAETSQETIRLE